MEKLMNILKPSKAQDDETLHGSDQQSESTAGNTGHLSGEGSHFKDNAPVSDSTTNTSGVASTKGLGGDVHPSFVGEGATGTNTNTSSGVSGQQTSGPHSSSIENKLDPRVDSNNTSAKSNMPGGWDNEDTSYGSSNAPQSNTTSGHHLGRDAAAVGTAGAVGEGIHHYDQQQTNLPIRSSDNTTSSSIAHPGTSELESSSAYNSSQGATGTQGAATSSQYPGTTEASSGLSSSQYPSTSQGSSGLGSSAGSQPTASSGHHLGRDAAAVGTAGAVGEGIHHHNEEKREFPLSSTTGPSTATSGYSGPGIGETSHHTGSTGSAIGSSGPHSIAIANLLDPAVNTHGSKENALEHDKIDGGGAEAADHDHTGQNTSSANQSTSGHHLGRDAAVAGGVGTAAYGAEHHKHDKDLTQAERDAKREHKHELKEEKRHHKEEKDHHLGRDAGIGAGAGAGALGLEHEHRKHETTSGSGVAGTTSDSSTLPGPAPTTAGPHSKDWMNKADPGVHAVPDPNSGADAFSAVHHPGNKNLSESERVAQKYPNDQHLGRNAAVAGGVGGAAYEADKHHTHDKDLSAAEKEAKKEHRAEEKEAKKEHKAEEKELKKEEKAAHKEQKVEHKEEKEHKPSLISRILHRDKSKKYTPEEEAEFDRQDREHNSHAGRDAAYGTAAVGAGGAAYEADKHHNSHLTDAEKNKSLPTAPGNHGIGTGAGTQNALENDSSQTSQSQSHFGRDAALGAGAAGATGYGVHEHDKHSQPVPLADKPTGTDLGDKLHGTDRNRGVVGSSGFPGTEGFGSGAQGHQSEATTGQGSSTTGSGHHYGRDAALAGGAGGLAEHEHSQHESAPKQSTFSKLLGGSNLHPSFVHDGGETTGSDNYSGASGQQTTSSGHQLGRDAAVAGGAGTVAEHEHQKHDFASDNQSNPGKTTSITPSTSGIYEGKTADSTLPSSGLSSSAQPNSGDFDPYSTANTSSVVGAGTPAVTGSKVAEGEDGHNRLHKDPPASHPAAQY